MVSKITSSSNRQVRTRVLLRANTTALINTTITEPSPPIQLLCLLLCLFLGHKLLIRLRSDDKNDNDNNDTDSNTNSNSNTNATNAADSSDTVNHNMNREEELFRSEHMEEVRTSFEIDYERFLYYHTSIALTNHIDWIRFDSIHSLAHIIDPLVLLSFFSENYL